MQRFHTLLRGLPYLALALLVGFMAHNYVSEQTAVQEANASAFAHAEVFAKEAFAQFEMVTPAERKAQPAPSLVWSAARSKVIGVIPWVELPDSVRPLKRWSVYAQTAKGNFYRVTYEVATDYPGKLTGQMRMRRIGFSPITKDEVKVALFLADLLDAYRALFGEPPPKKVDA